MVKNLQKSNGAFHFIMESFVRRGFRTTWKLPKNFGIEGEILLHDLTHTSVMPMWLYPGTDLMVSLAPFNNLPNQYRITERGNRNGLGSEALKSQNPT